MKLSKEQLRILSKAKQGRIPNKDWMHFQALLLSDKKELVKKELGPITIVDDRFDGREDKSETYFFNPDLGPNQLFSFIIDRYGHDFGLMIITRLMFSNLSNKKKDIWIRHCDAMCRRLKEI
jgi:hypothetical protein